jgi:hypothetical protein
VFPPGLRRIALVTQARLGKEAIMSGNKLSCNFSFV